MADLNKNGASELDGLRMDHSMPEPNRGSYRVGRNMDAIGNINGGWGSWLEISNWDPNQNQVADLAVGDLGPAGLGLVGFQIQHVVPARSRELFRIGRKLDPHHFRQARRPPSATDLY